MYDFECCVNNEILGHFFASPNLENFSFKHLKAGPSRFMSFDKIVHSTQLDLEWWEKHIFWVDEKLINDIFQFRDNI